MIELSKNEVVLFQGDSITDGGRQKDGYHREINGTDYYDDLNHAIGHSFPYILSAKLALDNIANNPKFHSRGVGGNNVVDMFARWYEDAINLQPTIISILIGINDTIFRVTSDEKFEKILKMIIEETQCELSCRIILCEPFYIPENENKYSEAVKNKQEIVKKLANEYNCIFVPLQQELQKYADMTSPKSILWDGIHPTVLGHEIIARKWLAVMDEKF